MSLKSVYSTKKLANEIVSDINEQLGDFNANLLIYFASSNFDQNRLSSLMQANFNGIPVFGCSTAGEIVSGQMLTNSVVAMAFDSETIADVKVEVVENISGDAGDHIDTAFANFERYFGVSPHSMDITKYVGIILIDGLQMKEEAIMDKIGDKTNVSFIGGSAGDDLKFYKTYVYANGKAYTNAAVLALLKSNAEFSVIKTQSFKSLDKVLAATKVDEMNREVKEFNNEPAAAAYAKALGVPVEEAAKCFMSNPVGLILGEDNIYVRSPQRILDNNTVKFYCNILEGMEVHLLEGADIVHDTQEAVSAKAEEFGHIAGMINFHCILRTLELQHDGTTQQYANIFKNIPTIGFSTYGEEYIGHINQTSTILAFKGSAETEVKYKEEINMNQTYGFFMPAVNLMGNGCIKDLGGEVKARGLTRALVVTDSFLASSDVFAELTDVLEKESIPYTVFDGALPNPTDKNVEDGLKVLKFSNSDFIISFGGGSSHDCAKGIALVAANGGVIHDYEGINKSANPMLPLIAVNTTSGTASEITRFCIITDTSRKVKMAIVDWHVTPVVSINDPLITVAMPPSLTAATGMDALTHAVEAYVSTIATPVTDACALKAIELIALYLKRATANGQDIEARNGMTYAQLLAGMAFNNASLGYVHAMAHQLGGFYDYPHGVCNAILLPHVSAYNAKVVPERFVAIAKALGENVAGLSISKAAAKAISAIKKLSGEVKIPAGLQVLGAKEEDVPILAANALKDACGFTNPKQATLEEIIEIYKKAF